MTMSSNQIIRITARFALMLAALTVAPLLRAQPWASASGVTSLTNTTDAVLVGAVPPSVAAKLQVTGTSSYNHSILALYGDTNNANGNGPYGAIFKDVSPIEGAGNGVFLDLQGNSIIRISNNLQLGFANAALLTSRG